MASATVRDIEVQFEFGVSRKAVRFADAARALVGREHEPGGAIVTLGETGVAVTRLDERGLSVLQPASLMLGGHIAQLSFK